MFASMGLISIPFILLEIRSWKLRKIQAKADVWGLEPTMVRQCEDCVRIY